MKTCLLLPTIFALALAQSPDDSSSNGPNSSSDPSNPDTPASPQSPSDPSNVRDEVGADDDSNPPSSSQSPDDEEEEPSSTSGASSMNEDFDFELQNAETFADGQMELTVNQDGDQVVFTMVCSTDLGWCAVGHGSENGEMFPATVYVCWASGDEVVLSQRDSVAREMPQESDQPSFEEMYTGVDDAGDLYACQFSVDPTDSSIQTFPADEEHEYLWAVGDEAPSSTDTDANIDVHSSKGAVALTASESGSSGSSGSSPGSGSSSAETVVPTVFSIVLAGVAGLFA